MRCSCVLGDDDFGGCESSRMQICATARELLTRCLVLACEKSSGVSQAGAVLQWIEWMELAVGGGLLALVLNADWPGGSTLCSVCEARGTGLAGRAGLAGLGLLKPEWAVGCGKNDDGEGGLLLIRGTVV